MGSHVTLEAELFGTLVELLADKKLERNALRVLVGARGLELGRPYLNLCQQGLIEEQRLRPGFWRRLFGARETLWVRVTERGLEVAAEALAEPPAELQPEPLALSRTESLPVAEPALPVPTAEAPAIAPPIEPSAPIPAPIADPLPAEVPEPRPEPVPEPVAVKASKPRRFTPMDFTETLGGAPQEMGLAVPSSDRLDGIAESVGLLGFELTEAGRVLAVDRWAKGQTDAEVALEVVTAALAHAARLDASGTTQLDREAALALAARATEALEVFVLDGLLEAERLSAAASQLTGFIEEPVATSGLEAYLLDPWRGIAPPAICPDEIYLRVEVEED